MKPIRNRPVVTMVVMVVTVSVTLALAVSCGRTSTSDTSASAGSSAGTTVGTVEPPGSTLATTTTAAPATVPPTTGPPASGTPTAPSRSTVQPDTAIWPFAAEATRYTDPVAAATSFATTYLGFVEPVVGAFQAGDSRSGEVKIQPMGGGPVTTVILRQLTADSSWWVLGASTPYLVVESPAAQSAITSPVTVAGQSTAFEATVNVEIRQDGTLTPLAKDITMGGSMGEMGPYSKTMPFTRPAATAGAIVLKTISPKDGTIAEATVVRVAFAP